MGRILSDLKLKMMLIFLFMQFFLTVHLIPVNENRRQFEESPVFEQHFNHTDKLFNHENLTSVGLSQIENTTMSLVAVSNEITTTLQSFVVENQKDIEFKTHSEIVSTTPVVEFFTTTNVAATINVDVETTTIFVKTTQETTTIKSDDTENFTSVPFVFTSSFKSLLDNEDVVQTTPVHVENVTLSEVVVETTATSTFETTTTTTPILTTEKSFDFFSQPKNDNVFEEETSTVKDFNLLPMPKILSTESTVEIFSTTEMPVFSATPEVVLTTSESTTTTTTTSTTTTTISTTTTTTTTELVTTLETTTEVIVPKVIISSTTTTAESTTTIESTTPSTTTEITTTTTEITTTTTESTTTTTSESTTTSTTTESTTTSTTTESTTTGTTTESTTTSTTTESTTTTTTESTTTTSTTSTTTTEESTTTTTPVLTTITTTEFIPTTTVEITTTATTPTTTTIVSVPVSTELNSVRNESTELSDAIDKIKFEVKNYTILSNNSFEPNSYSLRIRIKGFKWNDKFNNVSSQESQELLKSKILPLLYKSLNLNPSEINEVKLLKLFKGSIQSDLVFKSTSRLNFNISSKEFLFNTSEPRMIDNSFGVLRRNLTEIDNNSSSIINEYSLKYSEVNKTQQQYPFNLRFRLKLVSAVGLMDHEFMENTVEQLLKHAVLKHFNGILKKLDVKIVNVSHINENQTFCSFPMDVNVLFNSILEITEKDVVDALVEDSVNKYKCLINEEKQKVECSSYLKDSTSLLRISDFWIELYSVALRQEALFNLDDLLSYNPEWIIGLGIIACILAIFFIGCIIAICYTRRPYRRSSKIYELESAVRKNNAPNMANIYPAAKAHPIAKHKESYY